MNRLENTVNNTGHVQQNTAARNSLVHNSTTVGPH